LNEGKTQSLQNNKYKNEIKDFEKENKKLKEEVESYSSSG
jgi:cell shape-determining protein MreC